MKKHKKRIHVIGNSDRMDWVRGSLLQLKKLELEHQNKVVDLMYKHFGTTFGVDDTDCRIKQFMESVLDEACEIRCRCEKPLVATDAERNIGKGVYFPLSRFNELKFLRDFVNGRKRGGKRRECARGCAGNSRARSGLPDDWIKDPYYSRIITPGWRPNDHAQVKPEDFEGAKDYVIACAERYLGSREYAESFWHFNAVRKWRAVDEKTSIGGLLVEYGRKLAERGDQR